MAQHMCSHELPTLAIVKSSLESENKPRKTPLYSLTSLNGRHGFIQPSGWSGAVCKSKNFSGVVSKSYLHDI